MYTLRDFLGWAVGSLLVGLLGAALWGAGLAVWWVVDRFTEDEKPAIQVVRE